MSCGSQTSNPPHTHRLQPAAHAPLLPTPPGWFRWLVDWQVQWRRREELRELDDRILRDVGLTREQIEGVARRPIW